MQINYGQLIQKRTSVRNYLDEPLKNEDKDKMSEYIKSVSEPSFGVSARFSIVQTSDFEKSGMKLGTYGFIKNANTFITAAATQKPYALESLGYQAEKIVLYATSLGLGTCWLGGTFKRSTFAKAIALEDDEFLPIAISVGYPAEKRTVREKIVRNQANSNNRKPWSEIFFYNDFDTVLSESAAGIYKNAFEMVRLSPSASNKQPWLIVFDEKRGVFHIYLNRTKNYAGNSMGFEIQKIDIGIAMCHLECALIDAGIKGEFSVEDPHLQIPAQSVGDISYEVSFKLN